MATTPKPAGIRRLAAFERVRPCRTQMGGEIGGRLQALLQQWLLTVPRANPGILEMFRDRDRLPYRQLLPWSGEFAGKYLTGAVEVLRLTHDPALRATLTDFVRELVSLQAADGYLGPWPSEHRLTGTAPNAGPQGGTTWDAWGHYHILLGLLGWADHTGDDEALAAASRIGDLLCRRFGTGSTRLVDTGSTEMNLAPAHGLCLLFRRTGEERYLLLARRIVDEEFSALDADGRALAGDYVRQALAGKEFFETPKPRWESLHPIMALAELHLITGEESYRQAFEHLWWSIAALDRHNNGGFSSGEQAQGNPYHPGAIETCCTIAWMAMSVEMLLLTGDARVADELELSLFNSVLGMHSPSGRWSTYNTPMDGVRKASTHDITFQAREGTPELNCCSVNSARGFGLLSDWALLQAREGPVLNWYGAATHQFTTGRGWPFELVVSSDYPVSGAVRIEIVPRCKVEFPLRLRIPGWSLDSRVRINGQSLQPVRPGSYLEVRREWARGDQVELDLDLSPHFWAGEQQCAGLGSIYRGPLLLAYDRRFNSVDPDRVPTLTGPRITLEPVPAPGWLPPLLLCEARDAAGTRLNLCDFASAGNGGSPYRSWLPINGCAAASFSRENPLRSARPAAFD